MNIDNCRNRGKRLDTPPQQESTTVILGEGPEAAVAVVDLLEELGVLR